MKLDEAIKGIQVHREQIHQQDMWDDPISLSDTMTKLAVYNSYLADNIAPLHKSATDKQYGVFVECMTNEMPVTKAEVMSRGESTQERHDYENVQHIYKATANLITVLQTRLKTIENQRRQEGIND